MSNLFDDSRAYQFSENKEFAQECERLFDNNKLKVTDLNSSDIRDLVDATICALTPEHRIDIAHDSRALSDHEARLYIANTSEEALEIIEQMKEVLRQLVYRQYIEEIKRAFEYALIAHESDKREAMIEESETESKQAALRFNYAYNKDVLGKNPFKLIQGAMPT